MYGGPGDTVPTPKAPGPSTPAPGPSTPAPATPRSPGPIGPGTPTSGPAGPTAGPISGGAAGAAAQGDDWWTWWSWNRDGFLEHVQVVTPMSGGSDNVLGALPRRLIESRIAPALLEELERSKDRNLRNAALLALGSTGDADASLHADAALELLEEHLEHPSSWTSDNALIALGRYGSGARTLAAVLAGDAAGIAAEPSTRSRAFAAIGLAETGLRTTNPDVRRYAILALARAVTPEKGEPHVGAAAVLGLSVLAELNETSAAECAAALPAVWSLLEDESLDVRLRAHLPRLCGALVKYGTPDERDVFGARLLEALGDDPRMEFEAGLIQAAGGVVVADEKLGKQLSERLFELTRDAAPVARQLAWIALGRRAALPAGARAAKLLVRATKRMRSRDEPWIALALGVFAHGEYTHGRVPSDDLLRIARISLRRSRSNDAAVAWALSSGLARDAQAADGIAKRLRDAAPGRAQATLAMALGMTRCAAAVEPLRLLAVDAAHDADTLESIAIGLGLCGDNGRSALLLQGFEGACCTQASTAHARALARVGDGRLIGPLVATLADERGRTLDRAWSAHALGQLSRRGERTTSARLGFGLNYTALLSSQSTSDRSGVLNLR